MIILGIDPGIANSGYGIARTEASRVQAIKYGHIQTTPKTPSEERLKHIFDTIMELMNQYHVDVVVLEDIFFSKNVSNAYSVGEVKGIVKLAAAINGASLTTYTPLQVKQAVVGYGKATKKQVQKMVQMLLKLKELPKPDHAADALAITICHARSHKLLKIQEKFNQKPS